MGQYDSIKLLDASFSGNDQWQRSGVRTYRAHYDTGSDEVYVFNNAAYTPGGPGFKVNQTHPSDAYARVTDIAVKLESPEPKIFQDFDQYGNAITNTHNGSTCYAWLIEVSFGPWNPLEHSPDGVSTNKPVTFTLEGYNEPIPLYTDVNEDDSGDGTPLLNSAYDYFNPGIEGDDLRFVLTVYRNEPSTFDFLTAMTYSNKLNVATWNGLDPKCVKLDPLKVPQIEYDQESNAYYYPMSYVFKIRLDTWQRMILDMGTREIDPADSTKRRTITEKGIPITEPAMLNGSGRYLPPPVNPGDINVFMKDIYKTADYSYFNLDNLFTLYPIP